MLDFRERNRAAARISQVRHISLYRKLLEERGSLAATRISSNKEELSRELAYELLAFYTPEELSSIQDGAPRAEAPAATATG